VYTRAMLSPKWKSRMTFLALVMAVLAFSSLASAQAWNHDPASLICPLHWGNVAPPDATCGDSVTGEVGMMQSPIDIVSGNALAAKFAPLLFKYQPTPLKIENTGHYVEGPMTSRATFTSDHSRLMPTNWFSFIFMRQANTLSTASAMTRSFTWSTPIRSGKPSS
jgi:carbonic anhydrase